MPILHLAKNKVCRKKHISTKSRKINSFKVAKKGSMLVYKLCRRKQYQLDCIPLTVLFVFFFFEVRFALETKELWNTQIDLFQVNKIFITFFRRLGTVQKKRI